MGRDSAPEKHLTKRCFPRESWLAGDGRITKSAGRRKSEKPSAKRICFFEINRPNANRGTGCNEFAKRHGLDLVSLPICSLA